MICFSFLPKLTSLLHEDEEPDTSSGDHKSEADDALPLPSWCIHLGIGLAEGGTVQGLLLLQGQLAPVTLLLLPQGLVGQGRVMRW